MIWDELDRWAVRRTLREIWTEERLAPRLPRHLYPRPGHQSRALGKRAALPLPRSWLGVGGPTPATIEPHTTH